MTLLDTTTQTDFDVAEATLLAQVRALDPNLDLRRGTVLRDTLIRPAAQLQALTDARCREQLVAATLADLATVSNPDATVLNNLLSNFNLTYSTGTQAAGLLKLVVSAAGTYIFDQTTLFKTTDGALFQVTGSVVIARSGGSITLTGSDTRYVAVIPVQALEKGTAGNLPKGTVLEPVNPIVNFVSASAYASFVGGEDAETVATAISRIPVALSHRALTSSLSVTGLLKDRFGGLVQAVSLQGFGSTTQQRDKVGLHGISGGGCVDAYVRTFNAAPIAVLTKTGTKTGAGSYAIDIAAGDVPGFYAVRAITDADGTDTPVESPSQSYAFSELRDLAVSTHRISSAAQAAFSAFQTSTITVADVVDTADTHSFKVEFYAAPAIAEIQEFVDSPDVRNQGADFLVRSPLMCLVGLRAVAYCAPTSAVTADRLRVAVTAYVNSLSFNGKLGLSELIHIMSGLGATRIGMRPGELSLTGRIHTATKGWISITGDGILDIAELDAAADLVSPATVVFVADPADIDITVRHEV